MSSLQYLKQLVEKRRFVAVLDDCFPNLLSAFRVAEYNWYLEHFPQVMIYSTNADFKNVHAEYAKLYPQYADRVKPYDESSLGDCAFAYINFLNNAYRFLPILSANCIPFLVTIYPGGGFGLGEPESDAKLDQVLSSPLLRGIIATQEVTREYLNAKGCTVPVHYIYGGVIHPLYFENIMESRAKSLAPGAINICFVAARYMPKAANKGYPHFIEAATQLIRDFPNLRFFVVGNFDVEEIPLDDTLRLSISYKGPITTSQLKEFYLTQDVIISPNRAFLLHPGNFDGFPTGCCVEASLCRVAMICSDELKLNRYYTNGVDIVICEPTSKAIIEAVRKLILNPDLLENIRTHGQITSRRIFHPQEQLSKRSELLSKACKCNEAEWTIKFVERHKMAEQTLAHQANNISTLRTELSALRQHISGLVQIIADQKTHISNIGTDWAARGEHISDLVQIIADQKTHISNLLTHINNIEAELINFQSSLYGKLRALLQGLKQRYIK